ncbi:ATP-binding protein [Brevundimonas faecalis]|uniref:HAMP domain-containing sensor histidine kinase n=1 Tax=Brevundimonas faecalis TaxID=947378 RepID=UPI00361522C8
MFSRPRNSRRRPSVWSTAGLRYAVAFSALFALGAVVMVAGVDYGLMRFAEAEVRDGLNHQMEVMRADADRHGTARLVQELNAEARNRDARRYLLLVEAPDGAVFSNGLTRLAVNEAGFRRNLPDKGRPTRWPDQTPNMLTLSARAADGGLLAVGRDIQHLDELRGGIRRYALWSGLALILLALGGGWISGRLFLRRLDEVNQAVGRIIAGQESARLPAVGLGREFDELAVNLNHMLDRQEAALTTLKTLSESVAHELRAPLNRVRNRLEDIAAGLDDPDARADALERALEETDQVSALFEALLALARIESGGAVLKTESVDASALVESVGEIYRPFVEEAGGRLEIDAQPTQPLRADSALLQQAVANLIENAVFHGGSPTQLKVAARTTEDLTIISVSDQGPGVPPEERDKVVRRFYRREHGAGRSSGSGLGLAMVDAVARVHGGALRLSDNAPGLRAELILPTTTDA